MALLGHHPLYELGMLWRDDPLTPLRAFLTTTTTTSSPWT